MTPQENDQAVNIAMQLMRLGVSNAGITELLTYHSHDVVQKQLDYLKYRSAKRPEAFIIEAVRNNYSPPKEFFYAQAQAQPAPVRKKLDEDTQLPDRQTDADLKGHGTEDSPRADQADSRLAAGGPGCRLELPLTDETDRPRQ